MIDPNQNIRFGDYTALAKDYSLYKSTYARPVLDAILRIVEKPAAAIQVADVGAGTGAWTSMLQAAGVENIVAIEPNSEMRRLGENRCKSGSVRWIDATGEATSLGDSSLDLVTMASSFHWIDFELGCREVNRILRPGGYFVALWNPRGKTPDTVVNAVDAKLAALRRTAGGAVANSPGIHFPSFAAKLKATGFFSKVSYTECSREEVLSPEQYVGQLRSAKQWRAELGTSLFEEFLRSIKDLVYSSESVAITRITKAWIAQKKSFA